MFAKQLTVFVENRKGRLCDVLDVLKTNKVNILSLSLADTTEFGLLRLIVDNPALGREKLTEGGFSSVLSDVSIIKIPHTAGSLQELIRIIDEAKVNIEYMYGLSIEEEDAHVVLKATDSVRLDEILTQNGVETLSSEKLANL